jgi:hypothetical protein
MAISKISANMIDGSLTSSLVTGSLPAVDGSALTGAGAGIDTETISNPTAATNPSGTGHLWVNKSSGEMFVCTDATAGYNIWKNVGTGSHGYEKPFGGTGAGTISGFAAGGYAAGIGFQITRKIEEYSFVTDGNKSSHGNLIARGTETGNGTGFNVGNSSSTHGYASGGNFRTPWQNSKAMDKFAFSSNVTATDQGDLETVLTYAAGQSSSTHGYISGGYKGGPGAARRTKYQRFAFVSAGSATDVGDLSEGWQSCSGQSSNTHGYIAGGAKGSSNYVNNIERFSFASNAATTDVGDLVLTVQTPSEGVSSVSAGYTAGGNFSGTPTNRIQKFAFVSNTNATNVGNMTSARIANPSTSSTTNGYIAGGSAAGNAVSNVIEKWSLSSDGSSSGIGTLADNRQSTASSQF